ncbi:MAG: cation:proton antiporter [Polyangiaceae bacterium]|nr:cation:proton antiporter [Polyangiaceae bacterium]
MDHGVTAATWLTLATMILAAKLGGEGALRLGQPAVLGELLAGVVLGSLPFAAVDAFNHEAQGTAIAFAAELGVMLLLFQVGLESSVRQMVNVAPRAGVVALLGVVAPTILGYGTSRALLPAAPSSLHLFVGATLCATSVGVTASVLKDAGVLGASEANIILGAAVIDDVLGLIMLAVVSAIAVSGAPDVAMIARISGVAVAFVVGSLAVGLWVMRGVSHVAARLRAPHVLGAVSIAFCLVLAGVSDQSGLAAIVGAYVAGLLLDDVRLKPFGSGGLKQVEEFAAPIVAVFAPVFFVRTGMNVKLTGFNGSTILLTLALVVAAFVGKLACGLGVRGAKVDRLTVGFGMVPRGEVGLIFADAGQKLVIGGEPLFPPGVYASLVAAVFVTTVVAPPALAARLGRLK